MRKAVAALRAMPYLLRDSPRFLNFLYSTYKAYCAESLYARNHHFVPTVQPTQLFPGLFNAPVRLLDAASRPGSTTCFEAYVLASLVQCLRPQILVEFGTFEGRTTLQLALNSPENAVLYTIDLPDDRCVTRYRRAYADEGQARRLPVGGLFYTHPESRKIKQILGDSALVCYGNLRGKVDFIFVDGDHGYDYVKVDSENAFLMLNERGVIVWHDYGGGWDDVARFLCEQASHRRLYHLEGTSLVVYGPSLRNPEEKLNKLPAPDRLPAGQPGCDWR